MKHVIERPHGLARLVLDPACLIDKFLDWLDELRDTLVPARIDELACNGVRADEALHDPSNS